jgi:DNA repair exonuclease SbcCD ATPase subunit
MMATTKLTSLTLRGFRSFADEATIQFPENGLVLIRGKSLDTPGVSSGSGKSSIFLALSHALGYCPFPATELQSWLTKTPVEVSLSFKTKSDDVTVTRGKQTSVTVGKDTITGAKPSEEKLQAILGLDSELLSALTYRPQQTRGLFLSKTNSEMQDFLSILLGMDKYEAAILEANVRIKNLPTKIEGQERILLARQETYKAVADSPQMEIVPVEEFERIVFNFKTERQEAEDAHRAAKFELETKNNEYNTQVTGLRSWEKTAYKQLGQFVEPPFATDTSKVDYWQSMHASAVLRLENLQKRIAAEAYEHQKLTQSLQQKCWSANEQLKKIPVIRAEIDAIRMHKCPRCHQQWNEGSTQEIEALENQFASLIELEVDLKSWKIQLEALASYQPPTELKEMQDVVEDIRNELVAAKNAVANERALHNAKVAQLRAEFGEKQATVAKDIALQYAKLRDTYDPVIKALTANAEAMRSIYDRAVQGEEFARRQLTDAVKKNKEAEVFNARLTAHLNELKASVEVEQQKLNALKAELATEQDLLVMLRGFMAKIFDEVLAEISWNTNQMLGGIPNVSHVSIGFRSETVTLKGTTKKSITPYLMIDGKERPLRSALSGGMLAAVELAVDLAVRTVISARSGHTPGWLVLDECFEGLGVTEKEACMALLAQAAKDTLILVIDHSNEFKELFTATIDVENKGGRSTIAA